MKRLDIPLDIPLLHSTRSPKCELRSLVTGGQSWTYKFEKIQKNSIIFETQCTSSIHHLLMSKESCTMKWQRRYCGKDGEELSVRVSRGLSDGRVVRMWSGGRRQINPRKILRERKDSCP